VEKEVRKMKQKTNKNTKILLLSSLLLFVILIITTIVYLYSASKNNGVTTGMTIVAIFVVSIAMLFVVFVLVLRKRREKKYSFLNKEYRDCLDDIMLSIKISNMNNYSKKQIEEDILDIFSKAQQNSRTLKEVIGDDKEKFITEVINAHGAKNNFLTYELSGFQYFIMYLFAVQIYDFVRNFNNNNDFFSTNIENSTIFLFGLIALVTIPLIMKARSVAMGKNRISLVVILYIIAPVITLGGFIFLMEYIQSITEKSDFLIFILDESTIIFGNVFMMIFGVGLILIAWWLKKLIQKRTLNKYL
jgi:DNA-binding ferritin-like protein (Dps family)